MSALYKVGDLVHSVDGKIMGLIVEVISTPGGYEYKIDFASYHAHRFPKVFNTERWKENIIHSRVLSNKLIIQKCVPDEG